MTPEITALRLALCDNGYTPLPLYGKSPPVYGTNNKVKGFAGWQNLRNVTRSQVEMWGRLWEDAENTGILTRETPAFDLDIYNEEAAIAAEEFIRERFEERGYFLPRIGLRPKRAIPFRTLDTFDKIWVNFEPTHDGKPQKIEFLCNGQQLAVDGIHPDTGKPYSWPLGQPWKTKRDELPYISAEEAQQLVDDVVELLVRDFGYVRAAERPKRAKGGNGQILNEQLENERDWQILIDNILKGHAWHDSLRDIIAKYAASGMGGGAITNSVRALMETTIAPKDQRWQDRFDDIPRLVESALDKYAPKEDESEEEEPPIITPPPQQPPPPPPGAGPQQGPQQGPQPQRGPQPGPRSRPGAKPSSRPKAPHEGEGLQLMTFAPIKYVVPSVIVEGLSILAGKPKLGKSWLMLHAAIAVARGGFTLGSIHCIEGDVLYCSLEDNERRLQSRMTKLLGVVPKWPKRFQYFTLSDDFPRLNNGGLDWLKEWIDSVP